MGWNIDPTGWIVQPMGRTADPRGWTSHPMGQTVDPAGSIGHRSGQTVHRSQASICRERSETLKTRETSHARLEIGHDFDELSRAALVPGYTVLGSSSK